jgi:hypothetical protein
MTAPIVYGIGTTKVVERTLVSDYSYAKGALFILRGWVSSLHAQGQMATKLARTFVLKDSVE